jgi:hypothetical protein
MDTAIVTTNRTPIQRPAQTIISPKALELFAELERARRARLHDDGCEVRESGMCKCECVACERWWSAYNELHEELGLDPWQWPAIPQCPFPPGSPAARDWRPDAESQALYDLLKEARRAAAASRRATPSPLDEEDTDTNANVDAGPEPIN